MLSRTDALLERKRQGVLTAEEIQELDYFMVIEHLMRMAKARAKKKLSENS